jgi:hypothetical protein
MGNAKKMAQVLLDEVRQNFASVVWTHKTQEKQADIYANRYKIFETCNIIFAGVTSCGVVAIFLCDEYITKVLTTLVSFGSFFLSAYLKGFDLKNLERQHRIAANKFIIVRNQLLHIIAELHMKSNLEQIKAEYQQILSDLNELYLEAPSTTDSAVSKASEALNVKNEYTYTDEEIDHFLPNNLKGGIH